MWASKYEYLIPQDEFPGMGKSGLSEKAWLKLMTSIKDDMRILIDKYDISIKKQNPNEF